LDDTIYITLPDPAKALLLDIARQYNGSNNGDLSATLTTLNQRGWTSNSKLRRALAILLDSELIILTRQGGRHQCHLYALSWESIDDCKGKLDIGSTTTPPRPISMQHLKLESLHPKKVQALPRDGPINQSKQTNP
jgi:hypothetical protein